MSGSKHDKPNVFVDRYRHFRYIY